MDVTAGDLIVVPPGVGHVYSPATPGRWDEVWATFAGPAFDVWFAAGLLDAGVWPLRPAAAWARRFRAALAGGDAVRRVAALQVFLADARAGRLESGDDWLAWAKAALDAREPAGAAASLGLSADALRKRFARRAGATPAEWRRARRIEQAAALLVETPWPLAEVAERCGFADAFHLSRQFKAAMGVPPSRFRRQHTAPRPAPPTSG